MSELKRAPAVTLADARAGRFPIGHSAVRLLLCFCVMLLPSFSETLSHLFLSSFVLRTNLIEFQHLLRLSSLPTC